MNARNLAYWAATLFVALSFVFGGVVYLGRMAGVVEGVTQLGYPLYFVSMLGAWKLLGGLVLLAPRLPLLKEWAYAGIGFDLVAAAVSHAAVGNPASDVITPLGMLGILAVSWALRPEGRKLGGLPRLV
jgi:hypothetical protein